MAADLALIVFGANDLTHFVAPQHAAAPPADAVRMLRAAGAEVVIAPAPDLRVVPWVPAQMRTAVRAASVLLQQAQTRARLAAGARVADIGRSSATGNADASLFSANRFHPSNALARTVRAAASVAMSRSAH